MIHYTLRSDNPLWYGKFDPVKRSLHALLNCEHKGEARGVVADLRVCLDALLHRTRPTYITDKAREALQVLLAAVANFDAQTFEETHAAVCGVCALLDIELRGVR